MTKRSIRLYGVYRSGHRFPTYLLTAESFLEADGFANILESTVDAEPHTKITRFRGNPNGYPSVTRDVMRAHVRSILALASA